MDSPVKQGVMKNKVSITLPVSCVALSHFAKFLFFEGWHLDIYFQH